MRETRTAIVGDAFRSDVVRQGASERNRGIDIRMHNEVEHPASNLGISVGREWAAHKAEQVGVCGLHDLEHAFHQSALIGTPNPIHHHAQREWTAQSALWAFRKIGQRSVPHE